MKKVTNHLTHLKTILILNLLTASLALNAQIANWTGNGNGTGWDDPANWNFTGAGAGFNNSTIFFIPNNATGPTTATGAAVTLEMEDLTINLNATATVPSNLTLKIGGNFSAGLRIFGTLTNAGGIIDIDNVNDPIFEGIYLSGILTNTGGIINIDNILQNGGILIFLNSTLTNESNGQINIGHDGGAISRFGIANLGELINDGSLIKIDNTGREGIFLNNTITNKNGGQILIGTKDGNIGREGLFLFNGFTFNNESGSLLKIQGISGNFHGIENNGIFKNTGINSKVEIDMAGAGLNGIQNEGNFTNEMSAEIEIDGTGSNGINNISPGQFVNSAKITIGANQKPGSNGIRNRNAFFNNMGGDIQIEETTGDGIHNFAGSFTNNAKITVGATEKTGGDGIENRSTFLNNAGGDIQIDETDGDGINNKVGIFTNAGKITVGAAKKTGESGIESSATFNNNASGEIKVEETTDDGIFNNGAFFTNDGKIIIGSTKTVGKNGIHNSSMGSFTNNAGGEIEIDKTTEDGIENPFSVIDNFGKMTIGAVNPPTGVGIDNNDIFNNKPCGEIFLFDKLLEGLSSLMTNEGLLSYNTTEVPQLKMNGFNNKGIIEDVQGTFSQVGFSNNEIVVAPTVANGCQNINPAFDLGNMVDFDILGVFWDAAGMNSAGTYDVNSNTFTANPVLAEGMHNLFVKIQDMGGGCTRIVSWKLTTQNCCVPPNITQHPGFAMLCPGNNFTFSVTATGTNLMYQWKKDGTNIAGETNSSLTLTNVDASDEGSYTCEVSNTCGNETSNAGTLTVMENINITQQPVGGEFCLNGNFSLSISATGSNPSYQWKKDGVNINGATNSTLNLTNMQASDAGSYTCKVTNACGTETSDAAVLFEDTTPPDAECQNHTVYLDDDGNASVTENDINNNSADNCGIQSLSLDKYDFDCDDLGNNMVTLTVTDISGNDADCTATVSVLDNISPAPFCQIASVDLDASGNASVALSDVHLFTIENCTVISTDISQSNFDCTDVGVNIITVTSTDQSGNSAFCISNVIVSDNVNPDAVCQSHTVELDSDGNGTLTANDLDGGSSDACGIMSLSASQTNFDCSDLGNVSVTLTVTDNNGNDADCTATVTVEDTESPDAICQNVTVEIGSSGTVILNPGDVNNGSTDNCSVDVLTVSPNSFDCSDVGSTILVTLTIEDGEGNSDDCTANVTVEDNEAPGAICQNATIELDNNGNATLLVSDIDNNSDDNCGIDDYQLSQSNFDCSDTGTTVSVTLTVTDSEGNTDNCTADVTIEDNENPDAKCKNHTATCTNGSATITVADIDDGSSDNCGFSMELDETTFSCSNGTVTVTLTVTDDSGNEDDCTAEVTLGSGGGTTLSVGDVSQLEGNFFGFTFYMIPVTRTGSAATSVDYVTSDGTATVANNDYIPTSGTLYWANGGANVKFLIVLVRKDNIFEPDEIFNVTLSNPGSGATLADPDGIGTILNDDAQTVVGNPGTGKNDFFYDGLSYSQLQLANNRVAMFPNPTREELFLTVPFEWAEGGIIKTELYDNSGRIIQTFEMTDEQHVLDVRELRNGMYNLLFFTENHGVRTERFVKID